MYCDDSTPADEQGVSAVVEEGYTQIPNFIIGKMDALGGPAAMVVFAIARKTVGWQKADDVISISQFETMTGLSRQGVINAIEKALKIGVIARTPDRRNGFRYRLVNDVDYSDQSTTTTGQPSGLELVNNVDHSSPPLVNDVDPQKKDLKKRKKDSSRASNDAVTPPADEPSAKVKTSPNRSPKRKAAVPAEPATPIEIRQALAEVCAIDLKHAHKTRILQVNDEAKAIWAMQQERGKSVVQTVKAIGMVAEYCRRSVYPYKDGQPITPSAIRNAWDSARQSLERTNGLNGHHHVAEPESEGQYISREELLATRGGGGK